MAYAGTQAQQALWARQCIAAADYVKIPREYEWGVYGRETNFGRYIGTSSGSAKGLMQFLDTTAAQYHYPFTNYPNKDESQTQFTAAGVYLRHLFVTTRSWEQAIHDYSGGWYTLADVIAKASSLPMPGGSGSSSTVAYSTFGRSTSGITSVDDGIDMTMAEGLGALGDGHVLWRDDTEWKPWGPFMSLSLEDGPRKGWNYYVAEGILPVRHIGDHVKRGDVIAQRAINGGNGVAGNIEAGWAGFHNHTQTLAQERGHGGERPSPEGEDFKGFYLGLSSGGGGGSSAPAWVNSGDLGAMFTGYDWSQDIENALMKINTETDTGYKYSQWARQFILGIKTFTTTGGR